MKKRIWILNHYAGKMPFNQGGRHYWFAKFLQEKGYEPVVFCANSKHSSNNEMFYKFDELFEEHISEEIKTPFVYVKTKPYSGNGKQRILNMISFYFNLKKSLYEYSRLHGKPDIILASSVHPLTLIAGLKISKKFGIKCICEMRDLWPEAIVAYSKKIAKGDIIARLMYLGEKWIYKKADALIFTQEGGIDYIKSNKWDMEQGGPIDIKKCYHINNGVDLKAFEKNKQKYLYNDVDIDNSSVFKVVYTGAIRRINNLGIILDVAKEIKDNNIRFIIFGDGDELPILKERLINEGIDNVVFKGRVSKQYIPSIVSKADLNLVHWEMNPLVKVGESYNKAFEYYAAGKPVFYTITPGYSIAQKYNAGRLPSGYSAKSLANDILGIKDMNDEDKVIMSNNARKVAKDYDFKKLTEKLIDIIEEM